MNFKDFYFGMKGFKNIRDQSELVELLRCSRKFSESDEIVNPRRVIILFESSEKRSTLIFTDKRVYKIFEDKLQNEPTLNWSHPIEAFSKLLDSSKIVVSPKNNDFDIVIFPNVPEKRYLIDKDRFILIGFAEQVKFLAKNSEESLDKLIDDFLHGRLK